MAGWWAAGMLWLAFLAGALHVEAFKASGRAFNKSDVADWMGDAWEAAKQNSSAWRGTESWMPSAEQTGHAEQAPPLTRPPYPLRACHELLSAPAHPGRVGASRECCSR